MWAKNMKNEGRNQLPSRNQPICENHRRSLLPVSILYGFISPGGHSLNVNSLLEGGLDGQQGNDKRLMQVDCLVSADNQGA